MWSAVACAMLAVIGLFAPSFELRVGGYRVGHHTSLSLYQAHQDRDVVRRLLVAYNHSDRRAAGARLTGEALDHASGRVKSRLGDAHDVLTGLDDVSDDDVREADHILTATILAFLLVNIALIALVGGDAIRGIYRKRRAYIAGAIALLGAVMALAIHIACREVRFEANDDLGRDAIALATGAYLIPFASLCALGAAIAFIVLSSRRDTQAA